MRFSFDDDQLAFRDAVRDLLAKECPPEAVRQPTRDVWDALAEMGVPTILVAEEAGGMGLDERWLVLLLEEAGYAGLPHPIVETAAVTMPLVADRVDATALLTSDLGGVIVPWAAEADAVLLDGPLRLSRDVAVTPVDVVDERRRAGRVTGGGDAVEGDRELAFDRGAWGTAAFLCGLGRRMLDMTVEYVKEREQFGVPIGSFQAVKHLLADTSLAVEMSKAVVLAAARSLGSEDGYGAEAASIAKALVGESAVELAQNCFQVFGGIGYTWEHDQHLYLRRLTTDAALYGDAAWHREHLCQLAGL